MLDVASSSLVPLPDVLSHGLVAVATFGLLSFFCSTSLFLYLTYRLVTWKKAGTSPMNQFLFLIYNLLFADIQQALAFLLNIRSLKDNGIIVGTSTCWAQAWFVSVGDLASSVFISAIACHTFFSVVKSYRPPNYAFYIGIAACWIFIYGLAVIGIALHPHDFYVRAAAWCWINDEYQSERLWLHYFWIFVAMFSTILIYTFIFIFLRTKSRQPGAHADILHGAQPLMILYPLIYTICTIPLAAGRIASLAGAEVTLGYFCVAGSMIACNGWLDVLLYASTRADIVFSEFPPSEDTGLETFAFMGKGHMLGTTTVIQAGGPESRGRLSSTGRHSGPGPSDSTDNLYRMGDISVAKNVSVRVSLARENEIGSGYSRAAKRKESSDSGWEQLKGDNDSASHRESFTP
ncbi:integral membrane protein [Rutstroemia sp. NJR-2017a WRK4]|nr:integral membrane protein [Rutstroemia sp. NJR-2017a WRK4]